MGQVQAQMAEAFCTEQDKLEFKFNKYLFNINTGKKPAQPENEGKDANIKSELKTASLKE